MAWTGKSTLGSALSVTSSALQTPYLELNPGEQAHIQVEAAWVSTPTDDLIVRVMATLDPSSEQADTIPIWSQTVGNEAFDSYISFLVSGVFKFRIEYERSGSSDATEITTSYRTDGVSM